MANGHCFRLPEDGELYTRQIVSRCEDFAGTNIWSGIETLRLRRWLGNFTTPPEKYFAACVLDRLVYRSSEQTCSLIRQLFQRSLPDACRRRSLAAAAVDNWTEALQGHADIGVRVVPVIRDNDPPTKSGPLVARLFRRHLRLNERWMIWPWQVRRNRERGVRTFLFADDFLGTGHQFRKFARRVQLREALRNAEAIYVPLMAHQRGLDRLREKLPWLQCSSVEVLDYSYDVFSDSHEYFADDHTNRPHAAREYYVDLMMRKGWADRRLDVFGYGGLSLVVAFEHATPNATLPVLWTHRASFVPLFDR